MELEEILKIVSIVLGALSTTIIPLAIKLITAIKAKKNAKTEADKQAAINDMLNAVNGFIQSAEDMYKQIDALVKANGLGTTGTQKKESVMTKLQAYALSKGYTFDAEYWSAKIDEIVALTRKVNAKNS